MEESCEVLQVTGPCLEVNLSTTIKITIIIRSKKLEIKEPHRDAHEKVVVGSKL